MEKQIIDEGEYETHLFETFDVPIPSYLVAFAIGKFDYLEIIQPPIRFRSYAAPSQVSLLQRQLNETVKAISIFQDLFDIPFPLKKLDSCTIPQRFCFFHLIFYFRLFFFN